MNEGEGYITAEISQEMGGGGKGRREATGKREELGIHILGRGVLFP